ncbi:MAG: hypothetical protein ACUZ77_13110 [Candidatus Brocadiales bacterium]
MPITVKDITPEKISEAVEILQAVQRLSEAELETLEVLFDQKQLQMLLESIESVKKEDLLPVTSILKDK